MDTLKKGIDKTSVEGYRTYRYNSIDARTGELISEGFTYSGKVFSFSENAQNNLLGTYSAKELLTYPFTWNIKDNSETYNIADATEMATFFMTALAAKKAHQDSGTALKTLIRDAVDITAMKLIIDNR